MSGRKQVVELSLDTERRLDAIASDLHVLQELVVELADSFTQALHQLRVDVATLEARPTVERRGQEDVQGTIASVPLPDAMLIEQEYDSQLAEDDPNRVRSTPFTRAPRTVQVEWLKQVLADGGWHSAHEIARAYATDERHLRYMKGALSGRLREMHEDGLVERRDSAQRGSLYEYRLVTP